MIYLSMSESNEINWAAFQFTGENDLWDEVHRTLEEFSEAEIQSCTSLDLSAEQRAYFCGKAAAIGELRDHLMAVRAMAINRTMEPSVNSKAH